MIHNPIIKKYCTIVVDPPWPIGHFPAWFCKARRSSRENAIGINPTPYATLSLTDIEKIPVGQHAADGGHLYLWTPDAFLESALKVVNAWGFKKSATLVWCKKPMGKGMGGTYPSNVEFVLFCRRVANDRWKEFGAWLRERRIESKMTVNQVCAALGAHGKVNHGGMQSNWENGLGVPSLEQWEKIKFLLGINNSMDATVEMLKSGNAVATAKRANGRWYEWKRGRHSQKPEAFQDLVESVSPGPYLELFARRRRLGWDAAGFDVDGLDITESLQRLIGD